MKTKHNLAIMLVVALALPVAVLLTARAAGFGRNVAPSRPQGPCDIYAVGDTPCVAAHSTVRALSAAYNGPLYQVMRQSDGKRLDIGIVPPSASPVPDAGGYADATSQDVFCANTLCLITRIYDQSGKGNHLLQAVPGTFQGPAKGGFDTLPIADMAPVTINGHKAYGVFIMPGMGFRNNDATGIAIDDEPEGIYYVIDGTHYDNGCCFDYGNSSTNGRAVGTGTMETTYFGTSTTWGRGDGPGPWIMSDMEAGLFSGYEAKQNVADPTVGSWRFVTAVVDGGGGNKWDLRGGNAQAGPLTTYYSGVRPGSQNNVSYFPMHKKGGILLGTGGDNGNGSSGTFYEGVMTTGYPTEATTDAVQASIVAAKYDVPRVRLSRVTMRTIGQVSLQSVIVTFTNTAAESATDVKLSLALPVGWKAVVDLESDAGYVGGTYTQATFARPVAPGTSVSASFNIFPDEATGAGFLTGKAEWTSAADSGVRAETETTRVRNVPPVKINEILLGSGTGQFIELYNAGATDIDISEWSLVSTPSQWAAVKLATIPADTQLAAHGFYLLALSSSGLAAPNSPGDTVVNVRSAAEFAAGQQIRIEGETRLIASVGTPAVDPTTLFIPVSTGPWLTVPAGSTNLPVTSAAGFVVGEKIGIDPGGHHEVATVTAVGKAATQTTLVSAANKGATSLVLEAVANLTAGNRLTIDTGGRKELATVRSVAPLAAGSLPTGGPGGRGGGRGQGGGGGTVELAAPLQLGHRTGIAVSTPGTGITFAPATKYPHVSGDAVQALGSGITLDHPLVVAHAYGTAVLNTQITTGGDQGPPAAQQWFGVTLSNRAGSIVLLDANGVAADAIVYGSRQGNSSANGTIVSPELATLEGDQGKGGCIVVVPPAQRGGRGRGAPVPAAPAPSRSVGRTADGLDTGNNCDDFQLQAPTPGAPNQKSQ